MSGITTLPGTDDILIVAEALDLRGTHTADRLSVEWVTEDDDLW